jgi:hypothetical protein
MHKKQKDQRKKLKGKSKGSFSDRRKLKAKRTRSLARTAKKKDDILTLPFVENILLAMLSDFFQTLPLYKLADYRHDVKTIKTRLRAEGLSFATKTLSCLSQGMFDHLEGRNASYPTFKMWDRIHPVFLKGLFRHALGLTRESAEDHRFRSQYVRAIYQISVAFKKLRGPYKKSKLALQYANFVEVDKALGKIDLQSEDRLPILRRARYLCSQFIRDYVPTNGKSIPRPGPGATNTKTRKFERYEPRKLFRQVHDVLDYRDWFYVSPFDVCYDAPSFLSLLDKSVDEPTSRFKFVPKTWDKARGICIEEFEVQWIQQGIRRGLTNLINSHPLYKDRIVLHDQKVNAELALYGSRWRNFATLDMSEASDRIPRQLVEYLFQDNEELCSALMALSTRWIEPPSEVKGVGLLRTEKFAPMGSALCFPIMSLVHMFLIRAIIQLSMQPNPHLLAAQVYVYGDDIVLPSQCVQAVYDWLPKFGMKLNETKSFAKSHFRESCGCHAYYGIDVTPIFIRETPKHWQGNAIKSLVETEYQLHKANYNSTARTVRESLISSSNAVDRFVPLGSTVVGFQREYNDSRVPIGKRFLKFSSKVRFNRDIQSSQRKEWVFKSITSEVGLCSDYHAYMRWYAEQPESRVVNDTSDGVCLHREWVPEDTCALGARI